MGRMNKKWDQAEFLAVSKAVANAINVIQTLGRFYGAPPEKMAIVELYSQTFQGKHTANQVVEAIKALGGEKLPLPHEIENFINPDSVKVTETQYIQACKAHERNNFDQFGQAAATIRRYTDQQADPYADRRPKPQQVAIAGPIYQAYPPESKVAFTTPSGQPLSPRHIPPRHRAVYVQTSQSEQHLETTAHLRGKRAGA